MACDWRNRVFHLVWERDQGCSWLSKKPVGIPTPVVFAHVLEKGECPKYMYKLQKVILLTAEEHSMLDHGTEEQRKNYEKGKCFSWDSIYKLRKKLLSEYDDSDSKIVKR